MCLLLIISGITLFAQNTTDSTLTRSLNSVSINLLGDASLISANYERLFPIRDNVILTGKLGLGYNEEFKLCLFGSCSPAKKYTTVPHHFTTILGNRRSYFEFGVGGTIVLGDTEENYFFYPMIGYRISSRNPKGVTFRIYVQYPISGVETEDIIFFPIGLSLGVKF